MDVTNVKPVSMIHVCVCVHSFIMLESSREFLFAGLMEAVAVLRKLVASDSG